MKFSNPILITEIAAQVGAEIIGDATRFATGLNEIHKVTEGDIMFVDVAKYFDKALKSAATFILLNEKIACPEGKVLLFHPSPFAAYNQLAKDFRPAHPQRVAIDPTADLHPTVVLEPNVVIGAYVKIGARSVIQANTVIGSHTQIGEDVLVQPNCTIGTDAFYFKKEKEGFQKWHSCGRVLLENRVDIGAGCTINKGVSGDTIIGEGSKLDAQIHIGHGVVVGKNCLFAAQVGIGGKTIVGDNVVLYGQVGIAQNLHLGDNVVVLAKSGVSKNLEANKTYFGYPAQEMRQAYKELATVRQLTKGTAK
jgi:UDP-3-O-[3-hydroxymyristoyl] glucosamine N-acyltransferase